MSNKAPPPPPPRQPESPPEPIAPRVPARVAGLPGDVIERDLARAEQPAAEQPAPALIPTGPPSRPPAPAQTAPPPPPPPVEQPAETPQRDAEHIARIAEMARRKEFAGRPVIHFTGDDVPPPPPRPRPIRAARRPGDDVYRAPGRLDLRAAAARVLAQVSHNDVQAGPEWLALMELVGALAEPAIIGTQCVRPCAGKALIPRLDEPAGLWRLPFVPTDGEPRRVHPGERLHLETGLRVTVPRGYLVAIHYTVLSGREGMMAPSIAIDWRYQQELVVPFRNEGDRQVITIRPGDYPFTMVICRTESAEVVPDESPE